MGEGITGEPSYSIWRPSNFPATLVGESSKRAKSNAKGFAPRKTKHDDTDEEVVTPSRPSKRKPDAMPTSLTMPLIDVTTDDPTYFSSHIITNQCRDVSSHEEGRGPESGQESAWPLLGRPSRCRAVSMASCKDKFDSSNMDDVSQPHNGGPYKPWANFVSHIRRKKRRRKTNSRSICTQKVVPSNSPIGSPSPLRLSDEEIVTPPRPSKRKFQSSKSGPGHVSKEEKKTLSFVNEIFWGLHCAEHHHSYQERYVKQCMHLLEC